MNLVIVSVVSLTGAFIGTVVGANWALVNYGVVGVGFGLAAPAGVFFAGLAFTFRDLLHQLSSRAFIVGAIIVGAVVSFFLEDARQFAVASGTAFLVSEFLDFCVYSPLRRKRWLLAVGLSNIVGLTADSCIFLFMAFGSLAFLEGQLVGKAYMTAGAILLLLLGRYVGTVFVLRRLASAK